MKEKSLKKQGKTGKANRVDDLLRHLQLGATRGCRACENMLVLPIAPLLLLLLLRPSPLLLLRPSPLITSASPSSITPSRRRRHTFASVHLRFMSHIAWSNVVSVRGTLASASAIFCARGILQILMSCSAIASCTQRERTSRCFSWPLPCLCNIPTVALASMQCVSGHSRSLRRNALKACIPRSSAMPVHEAFNSASPELRATLS